MLCICGLAAWLLRVTRRTATCFSATKVGCAISDAHLSLLCHRSRLVRKSWKPWKRSWRRWRVNWSWTCRPATCRHLQRRSRPFRWVLSWRVRPPNAASVQWWKPHSFNCETNQKQLVVWRVTPKSKSSFLFVALPCSGWWSGVKQQNACSRVCESNTGAAW